MYHDIESDRSHLFEDMHHDYDTNLHDAPRLKQQALGCPNFCLELSLAPVRSWPRLPIFSVKM